MLLLLELLQDRVHASGDELAERLGVSRRTLRRDIAALQEMGIPIEGQRGVGGGYQVRPGFRLPLLMLKGDEAVAVVLGLLEARASRLPVSAGVVDAALAKVYRVLPTELRRQVAALEQTVLFAEVGNVEPIPGDVALQLAEALRRGLRIEAGYTAYSGASTTRRLSPWSLVVHCGFWYLVAFDHLRDDLRTFRVDRMRDVRIEEGVAAQAAPPEFEPLTHLQQSLASVPGAQRVSVVIDLPLEVARSRLPASVGVLTATDAGTRLEVRVESLAWIARTLASLGCRLSVERPPELRDELAGLGRLLQESTAAHGQVLA